MADGPGRAGTDETGRTLVGRRVLVISGEQVGERMAGPAIRSLELARQLSARGADVTLGVPGPALPDVQGIEATAFGMPSAAGFRRIAADAHVILTQPQRVDVAWGLRRAGAPVIYDMYVPSFIERIAALADQPASPAQKARLLRRDQLEYAAAIEQGAGFICASQRQRDHWLGALGQAGRFDVGMLQRDPTGDALVGIVPFGVPDAPPPAIDGDGAIRGRLVPADSIVLLWTGGLWNWFDPITLIEGLAAARASEPRLRLVVMGGRHPEARWEEHQAARDARERAEELGLVADGAVVFNDDWVPYGERHRYLCDSDIGVSAHHDSLEARLSFRTRFLDHIWSGLPTVSTVGGALTDEMELLGAARTVGSGDAEAWRSMLVELAGDTAQRAALRRGAQSMRNSYHWSRVSEPLARMIAGVASSHGGSACSTPQRPRRLDAARYAGVLVQARVDGKGLASLGSAFAAAARSSRRA